MKRVVIVDFNHLAHTYLNSQYRLSKTRSDGTVIDTTIPNGVIKAIHRWSDGGSNPTAVCFDSPIPSRKAYFSKMFDMPVNGDKGYKGGRASMSDAMFQGIELTKSILQMSGVSCYKKENYEADDIIFACIETAKRDYPGVPIDVVTNDADLLPLVDEQVSVFLRSRKFTWAESADIEKIHYVQVTPENFSEVVQDRSDYKGFTIPYNTLLLHKLLRGDSSDNINNDLVRRVKRMFPPTKFNALIATLENDGKDFSTMFRYGKCKEVVVSKSTGERVEDIENHPREDLAVKYEDPEELVNMIDQLCWYIEDEEVLQHIKRMYKGMNLNQAYMLGNLSRRPVKLTAPISTFNEVVLRNNAKRELDINISIRY